MNHRLHPKHDSKIFIYFVVTLLLALGFIHWASAAPVDLGKFGDYNYFYDDSLIVYTDNMRVVLVGTADPRFNILHESNYGGAVGQIALDCSGHAAALISGFIFDTEGVTLHQRTIPDQDWAFFSIKQNTIQDRLYRLLCVQHTAI